MKNIINIASVTDEKTTYMGWCNLFIGLWTQSSLESVTDDTISPNAGFCMWYIWKMCKNRCNQTAPFGYVHEEAPQSKLF